MSHQIHNTFNNSIINAEMGETILDAALRDGRLYPYGCQSGFCGACKSKLISGTVEHLSRNPDVLSNQELADGYCLPCQAVPQGDIEVDVKEAAKVKEIEIITMPTRVRQKTMLAEDVVQLNLTVAKTKTFDFLPGQYINILLSNGKERSFSIANTPNKVTDEGIELHIRVVPDGHYSPQVKNSIAVKDIIRIQGPFGTYFLRKDNKRPLILIAGGTGFAPIKSLIEDAIESDLKQAITLYWGARTQADLYMGDIAQKWANKIEGFSFIPVLSEVESAANWQGETGFVHETILRNHADLSEHAVYASGPPVMINALKNSLPNNKLDNDFFYTDSFDYAAIGE